jgi:hypothetical protein
MRGRPKIGFLRESVIISCTAHSTRIAVLPCLETAQAMSQDLHIICSGYRFPHTWYVPSMIDLVACSTVEVGFMGDSGIADGFCEGVRAHSHAN